MPTRLPDTTVRGPATAPSIESQRELARLTAEKIDRIESEMIPGTRRPAALAPTLPMRGRTEMRQPVELPALDIETVSVLDRSGAAEAAIEVNPSTLAPEIEEAAILYANDQARAAVVTLGEVLTRGRADAVTRQAFRMQFDALAALGARDEFETCAIDFAARFERSPPPWPRDTLDAEPLAAGARSGTTVRFTQRVDAGSARLFEQGRRACVAGKPVTLEFTQVREVDAEGALGLCALFESLEQGQSEVSVSGADALLQAARAAIEPGRRDETDAPWRVALLALRVAGDQPGFDDLAIEYCVTFELSPPAWEPLPARFRNGSAAGRRAARDAAPADDSATSAASADLADLAGPSAQPEAFQLRGELVGMIASELSALRDHAEARKRVTICCRQLARLDFVAAGELLNELVALAARGKVAVFDQPSAIVEALLTVMGISELAEVRARRL